MRIQAVEFSHSSLPHSRCSKLIIVKYLVFDFLCNFFARVHVLGCYVARFAPRGGRQEVVGRGEGGSKSVFRRSRASISRVHFGQSLAASGHV